MTPRLDEIEPRFDLRPTNSHGTHRPRVDLSLTRPGGRAGWPAIGSARPPAAPSGRSQPLRSPRLRPLRDGNGSRSRGVPRVRPRSESSLPQCPPCPRSSNHVTGGDESATLDHHRQTSLRRGSGQENSPFAALAAIADQATKTKHTRRRNDIGMAITNRDNRVWKATTDLPAPVMGDSLMADANLRSRLARFAHCTLV